MTFFWLTLLATWFSVTEGLSLVSHTPATALFWFNARFIGLAGMPVAWFAFALQYTDRQRWLTTQRVVGLVATPLVTQMIIWTNDAHGLWIQKHVGFFQAGPFMIADTGMRIPGLWFWVHITYSYSLTLLAILLLALVAIRSFHLYREQAVALWLGVFFILTLSLTLDVF